MGHFGEIGRPPAIYILSVVKRILKIGQDLKSYEQIISWVSLKLTVYICHVPKGANFALCLSNMNRFQ